MARGIVEPKIQGSVAQSRARIHFVGISTGIKRPARPSSRSSSARKSLARALEGRALDFARLIGRGVDAATGDNDEHMRMRRLTRVSNGLTQGLGNLKAQSRSTSCTPALEADASDRGVSLDKLAAIAESFLLQPNRHYAVRPLFLFPALN
jgi:hypothetical protein